LQIRTQLQKNAWVWMLGGDKKEIIQLQAKTSGAPTAHLF